VTREPLLDSIWVPAPLGVGDWAVVIQLKMKKGHLFLFFFLDKGRDI
jgi:hypothetical protein